MSKPSYNDTRDYNLNSWKLFNENNLLLSFFNLDTAIKLYLTIPMAKCWAERAFSKLVRINNKYRTSSLKENVTNLMVLRSENNILGVTKIVKIIDEFASKKTKKQN